MSKRHKKYQYIGLDIDSTVVQYAFPELGPLVPDCIKWLKKFQELGYKIVVNTMRSDGRVMEDGSIRNLLSEAIDALKSHGIEIYGANRNPDQMGDSPKVYANVYIDDAAAGCALIYPENDGRPYVDWEEVGPEVIQRLRMLKERDEI